MEWITNPAVLALIGTVFGGVGLKAVEHHLRKPTEQQSLATQLRSELRQESGLLRAELRRVEEELDKWKQRYYELLDRYYQLTRKEDDAEKTREAKKDDSDW